MVSRITLTDTAKSKLKDMDVTLEKFLRLRVAEGGCSGMSYQAVLDSEASSLDTTLYEDEELRIVSDERSVPFLEGITIDYSNDLIRSGFRFSNPNATSSCGCGSSFAV